MRLASACILFGLASAGLVLPAAGQVVSPTKRQAEIDKAKAALTPRAASLPASDPFHSEAFNTLIGLSGPEVATPGGADAQATGPRNARDLIRSIAAGLKPSGVFVVNGEPTLVFGQKRVKSGGILTITFEGAEHTLEIVSVAPPNFTLRLNREEFTRPIK